jgi:hypothetical protein
MSTVAVLSSRERLDARGDDGGAQPASIALQDAGGERWSHS